MMARTCQSHERSILRNRVKQLGCKIFDALADQRRQQLFDGGERHRSFLVPGVYLRLWRSGPEKLDRNAGSVHRHGEAPAMSWKSRKGVLPRRHHLYTVRDVGWRGSGVREVPLWHVPAEPLQRVWTIFVELTRLSFGFLVVRHVSDPARVDRW
jgi:hypothetical protein